MPGCIRWSHQKYDLPLPRSRPVRRGAGNYCDPRGAHHQETGSPGQAAPVQSTLVPRSDQGLGCPSYFSQDSNTNSQHPAACRQAGRCMRVQRWCLHSSLGWIAEQKSPNRIAPDHDIVRPPRAILRDLWERVLLRDSNSALTPLAERAARKRGQLAMRNEPTAVVRPLAEAVRVNDPDLSSAAVLPQAAGCSHHLDLPRQPAAATVAPQHRDPSWHRFAPARPFLLLNSAESEVPERRRRPMIGNDRRDEPHSPARTTVPHP